MGLKLLSRDRKYGRVSCKWFVMVFLNIGAWDLLWAGASGVMGEVVDGLGGFCVGMWPFLKTGGPFCGCPCNKSPTIWGLYQGP